MVCREQQLKALEASSETQAKSAEAPSAITAARISCTIASNLNGSRSSDLEEAEVLWGGRASTPFEYWYLWELCDHML